MDAPAVNRGMFTSHFLLGLKAFGVLRLPFFQSLTSPNGRPSQVLSHPAVICVRAKPWTERRLGIPALEGEGIRTNNVRTIHRPHNMSQESGFPAKTNIAPKWVFLTKRGDDTKVSKLSGSRSSGDARTLNNSTWTRFSRRSKAAKATACRKALRLSSQRRYGSAAIRDRTH
jgi:hypothetical protein